MARGENNDGTAYERGKEVKRPQWDVGRRNGSEGEGGGGLESVSVL